MPRIVNWLLLGAGAFVLALGCAHFVENRTIERFTASLEKQDLDELKAAASEDFDQKALRLAESLDDLKIIKLPTGETTVVEVEEVSDGKKRVTVQVGTSKKEIFYELVRDSEGTWVVNDIYMKQKRKGVESYRSVTEQMDLLLTVREVLTAWRDGSREQVLATTGPELHEELSKLPPTYLAKLTRRVSGKRPKSSSLKPKADLEGKLAVVRLPRVGGETVFTFAQMDGTWKVSEIGIDSRDEDEHLASLRKLANAVNSGLAFLASYQQGDKTALAEQTDPDFFKGSLSVGELSHVRLPSPRLDSHELEIRIIGAHADLLLRNEREIVKVTMGREQDDDPSAPTRYRIQDVTIYDVESTQEMRLSALFTAQAMMEIFWTALANPAGADLDGLRHSSTRDLTRRVWEKLNSDTIAAMPLRELQATAPDVVNTTFQGALTTIEARHGDLQVTYQLREYYGRFFVDDVLVPVKNRPASLKTTLQTLIPVREFATGLEYRQLDLVQRHSSADFNRTIWTQGTGVPDMPATLAAQLKAPLRAIRILDGKALVVLGDDRFGAQVSLAVEHEQYVVDDVLLISGPEQSQRLALKTTLRNQLLRHTPSDEPAVTAESNSNPPTPIPPRVVTELEPIDIGPIQ